jgi:hypothetical protein
MSTPASAGAVRKPLHLVVALVMVAALVAGGLAWSGGADRERGVTGGPAFFVPDGSMVSQDGVFLRVDDSPSDGLPDTWLRIYRNEMDETYEVIRGGRRRAVGQARQFVVVRQVPGPADADSLTVVEDREDDDPMPLHTDVTGDGITELLVADWTGGVNCCFNLDIVHLEPEFSVQRLHLGRGGAGFVQADSDPDLEVEMHDWTFAGWNASYAGSPALRVVLKFDGHSWTPCDVLMRRPPPLDLRASELSAKWRRFLEPGDCKDSSCFEAPWGPVLELIYTGNAPEAWRLLDAAWPGDAAGKRDFKRSLLDHLRTSPVWPALVRMNGAALEG